MKNKMEGNFTFEIGERALDGLNNEVTVLKKSLRPDGWTFREQYLVEKRGFWYNKQEWILQVSLTKIITSNK